MGGAVLPLHWLFSLRWPNTRAPSLPVGADDSLWEGWHQWETPRTAAASVFVPSVRHSHPPPLQETLQHWQVGLTPSLMGSLLFSPGSFCTQDSMWALQEWSFCFSQSRGSPATKPHWSSKPDSLGTSPIIEPPGWEAWRGGENFHSCGITSVV